MPSMRVATPQWSAVQHLATSIWMMSDPTVLYSPTAFTRPPLQAAEGTWARSVTDVLAAGLDSAAEYDRSGLFFVR